MLQFRSAGTASPWTWEFPGFGLPGPFRLVLRIALLLAAVWGAVSHDYVGDWPRTVPVPAAEWRDWQDRTPAPSPHSEPEQRCDSDAGDFASLSPDIPPILLPHCEEPGYLPAAVGSFRSWIAQPEAPPPRLS